MLPLILISYGFYSGYLSVLTFEYAPLCYRFTHNNLIIWSCCAQSACIYILHVFFFISNFRLDSEIKFVFHKLEPCFESLHSFNVSSFFPLNLPVWLHFIYRSAGVSEKFNIWEAFACYLWRIAWHFGIQSHLLFFFFSKRYMIRSASHICLFNRLLRPGDYLSLA